MKNGTTSRTVEEECGNIYGEGEVEARHRLCSGDMMESCFSVVAGRWPEDVKVSAARKSFEEPTTVDGTKMKRHKAPPLSPPLGSRQARQELNSDNVNHTEAVPSAPEETTSAEIVISDLRQRTSIIGEIISRDSG